MVRILKRKINDYESLKYTGEKVKENIYTQIFKYNEQSFTEKDSLNKDNFDFLNDSSSNYWLNFHGIHDVNLVKKVCDKYKIDFLVIQDIIDVNQRTKFQEFENYYFFTLKSVVPSGTFPLSLEQVSFILGKNFLISFQESKADYFEHIRVGIRDNLGLVRKKSVDFLLFILLETILDNYSQVLENFDLMTDKTIITDTSVDPSPDLLKDIENLKREVYKVKRRILPIKEFISIIEREKFNLISDVNIKYFLELKDICFILLDHCERIILRLESSINMFFSVQGYRMNQIMKTLTIVATLFIPLTFIVGVYGMNFKNMPELNWEWGYFFVWGVLLLSALLMIMYFKRKKWF